MSGFGAMNICKLCNNFVNLMTLGFGAAEIAALNWKEDMKE